MGRGAAAVDGGNGGNGVQLVGDEGTVGARASQR